MRTYVLFIFGDFEDHDDVVFFINQIFETIPSVSSLNYILEEGKNLILIFDSDKSEGDIMKDLFKSLTIEQIKFYFLFEKEGLVTAKLPKDLKDQVFKPRVKKLIEREVSYDLDDLLEKIEKSGIGSLTPEEKKFLDNFGI